MNSRLNVRTEIGRLKSVLLHRPGKELENLVPNYLERLLFDDIPYLKSAIDEHDSFAKTFKDNGVETIYLEDLASEAIADPDIRDKFIEEFLDESNINGQGSREVCKDYFSQFNNAELILKLMSGVRKSEIKETLSKSLVDMLDDNYPFIIDPMPNLYFTRDPFAIIGNGVSINHMRTNTRNRETIFAKYIFKYHKNFKDACIPIWYNRDENYSIEGGDILVLNEDVIAIGISQRTSAVAVERIAKRLLWQESGFNTILAFDIPKKRAFMHLDTVFTMIDRDKFTIHPEIEGPLTVLSMTKGTKKGSIKIEREKNVLQDILKKYLKLDNVDLIRCGNGNPVDAAREQWNDGSNTLAIAPGEVIVYNRNFITNNILKEHGIIVHEIEGSELVRGRGGPRCMSMPLIRENL